MKTIGRPISLWLTQRDGLAAVAISFIVAIVAPTLHAGTSFIVGGTRGYPATTVSVPVVLRGETNVVALQADILFDTNSLISGAVTSGGTAANHIVALSEPAAGVRRLLLYSLNNTPLSNGVLANLSFSISPGTHQNALRLSLSNVLLVTAAPTPVVSTNFPGVIVINPVFVRPDGIVDFFLTVVPRDAYTVQGSSDLISWLNLGSVAAPSAIIEFTDTNAPVFPYRFYRAVSVP